jgi:ribose 5-phosphate isomerase B
MKISIGADHAGFQLKERLKQKLIAAGHQVADHGTASEASCDYPEFAKAVGADVVDGAAERGILVCGTGAGMSIAANKIDGIRAAMAATAEQVRLTRQHNDANILAVGARTLEPADAEQLVDIFLETEFEGGRHARRVALIAELERGHDGAK